MKKFFISFIIFLFIVPFSFGYKEEISSSYNKKILMISSYHQSAKWSCALEIGYNPFLLNKYYTLVTEYLDSKRFCLDSVRQQQYCELFNSLYGDTKFDLILITDNAALSFVDRHYRNMPFMKDLPIIACGINYYQKNKYPNISHAVVIRENINPLNTLNKILTFFPKTKNIYVLNDNSKSGIAVKENIKSDLSKVPAMSKINFIYSQDVSLQEIGKEISNLPSNSVVLIGVYSLNSWKQYIAPEEVARYFQRINAQNGHEFPFFCLFDVYMSPEVIGGKVNEGRIQGELLGKAAVQLLQTGKISSEITNPDIDKTKWIFSYSALQKYGLEKSINCEESIVLYQPDSFFAKYSKYVILAFSFGGILLLFLLLVSYFNIVLRRQVDKRTKQRDELLWKFEHFIAKMPVGYIETDKNRNIKAWNKTCEKMFGHTFEEVKGRNIIDIVVQEENKKVAKELISSLAKEDVKVSSFDGNISRWGRVMICEWYFTTLYDKEGNIIYHLCLVIDKTEKEQLRKNLEFMLRKNKELLLEHDRFVANSMHDLKNLLTPLIAYSEMMMYNNLSLEKIQTVSEQLNRSANMLVEICTELMNISKIRGELTTVSPVEFDIYEMIRDIIYMTEANYSRKNITVVNEIPENQKLFADPEMVSSVVLNLLSNAAKFTYPNGHIVVSGQMVSDTQFEVMVSDDGMGFKVDNLIEQIGESTYFTTPGTAGEQGTGLGLILVKDLVEKNHGSVRAYNNTTRGATFTFTLPCKKHEEI